MSACRQNQNHTNDLSRKSEIHCIHPISCISPPTTDTTNSSQEEVIGNIALSGVCSNQQPQQTASIFVPTCLVCNKRFFNYKEMENHCEIEHDIPAFIANPRKMINAHNRSILNTKKRTRINSNDDGNQSEEEKTLSPTPPSPKRRKSNHNNSSRRKQAQIISHNDNSNSSCNTVMIECRSLLERMKCLKYDNMTFGDDAVFGKPINWEKMGISNYPQVIKHPMDLSTVENKLNDGLYGTQYEFAKDMRLIYQNCCIFNSDHRNSDDAQFYKVGNEFAKQFEARFEQMVNKYETNEFTKQIAKIVSTLMITDTAAPFRMAVNPKHQQIPRYPYIIDNPMDLGTIMNKINLYTSFDIFVKDLFLVWNNCCRFNVETHSLHQMALQLRQKALELLSSLCQQV